MSRRLGAYMIFAVNVTSSSVGHAGLRDRLPPEAYVDPIDRQIARTGIGVAGRPYPCARDKIEQGIAIVEMAATERCVRMLPSQRWRGLWRNDFEGSQFCPAPAKTCEFTGSGDRIWLTSGPLKGQWGAEYAIDIIGRRTLYRGQYGHLGMSDHELVVERVLSAKMIEAPRKR